MQFKPGCPAIHISIDLTNETYDIDFEYCNIQTVYVILKNIIKRIETGEIFQEDVNIEDINGNKISPEDAKEIIDNFREEIANIEDDESELEVQDLVINIDNKKYQDN